MEDYNQYRYIHTYGNSYDACRNFVYGCLIFMGALVLIG